MEHIHDGITSERNNYNENSHTDNLSKVRPSIKGILINKEGI